MHLVAIRRDQKKYEKYKQADDTLPVIVRYSNLESTLIPFGEEVTSCPNKMIGSVPLKNEMDGYQKVNEDKSLLGYIC